MNPLEQTINLLASFDETEVSKILLDTFAKYSSNTEEYDLLAKLYFNIKEYASALSYTEKVLERTSDSNVKYCARSNLAKLLNNMNDPEKALYYIDLNQKISPKDPEILLEKSFSLFLLNRKRESENILRNMKIDSKLMNSYVVDRIDFNLGVYDLHKGKFKKGLEAFIISGKKCGIWKTINMNLPYWDGEVILGRTIIIMAEGGIGDEIINVRFMKNIKNLGMNPVWVTSRKDLAEVFNRNDFYTVTSIDDIDTSLDSICWVYAMSLPLSLNLNQTNLWERPYLSPKGNKINLDNSDKIKIGIKWFGNSKYEQNLHRSLDIKELYNLLSQYDNLTLFSLQQEENILDSFPNNIIDMADKLIDWESTLDIINSLDMVITSCTSIAHASASMGKMTIVIVPITEYYIWASTSNNSSIWYGKNVIVLRQVKHKSWKEPIEQIANYLSKV